MKLNANKHNHEHANGNCLRVVCYAIQMRRIDCVKLVAIWKEAGKQNAKLTSKIVSLFKANSVSCLQKFFERTTTTNPKLVVFRNQNLNWVQKIETFSKIHEEKVKEWTQIDYYFKFL